MDRSKIKKLDAEYIVHTYNRYDVVADHAYRATITDVNGKEFIDLCSGYGANSLGYGHKAWLDAVKAQLDQVQHTVRRCSGSRDIPCIRWNLRFHQNDVNCHLLFSPV